MTYTALTHTDDRPLVDTDFVDLEDVDTAPYTKAQARRVTEMIKLDLLGLWRLIADAYKGRIWIPLGYPNWDEYCLREFGNSRLRMPREERAEVVGPLRESGLSDRAIESATGISRSTLIRDRRSGGVNDTTSEPVDEDALAEELIAAEPAPIIGTDGKTYRHQRKPAPTPGPTASGNVREFAVVRPQREPEPTPPAQRRIDDNEIKFILQVRSTLRDLDTLMDFAKSLDPDAKRKVLDKHQAELVDCAAKLVAINHELSSEVS